AEALRKEGLDQRLSDLAACGKRIEFLFAIGLIVGCDRERKAFEFWISLRPSVGAEDRAFPKSEFGMHDLILGGLHALLIRTFAKPHHHARRDADCLLVEIECFFATAVEENVGYYMHGRCSLL